MKYLARFIMWLAGWKYKGELPAEKKAVIISVPHTSNWDFFWGELAFLSQGIPAFILMKKEFFFFPLVFRFIWAASIIKENIVKWGLCFIRRRMWMLI